MYYKYLYSVLREYMSYLHIIICIPYVLIYNQRFTITCYRMVQVRCTPYKLYEYQLMFCDIVGDQDTSCFMSCVACDAVLALFADLGLQLPPREEQNFFWPINPVPIFR